MRSRIQKIQEQQQGLTLVETIAGIVIISIILLSIVTLLTQTAKTNRTSEQLIDATYIAQTEMETIYKLSLENKELSEVTEYNKQTENNQTTIYTKIDETNNYKIEIIEQKDESPMRRIIVKVYDQKDNTKIKAQMESLYNWEAENEVSP